VKRGEHAQVGFEAGRLQCHEQQAAEAVGLVESEGTGADGAVADRDHEADDAAPPSEDAHRVAVAHFPQPLQLAE